jgi:RHS repeat-associated protein
MKVPAGLPLVALVIGAYMSGVNQHFRHLILGFFTAFFGFAFAVPGSAQTIRHTENSVDSSLRSSENVDPSTLNMRFSISLGEYPGRGADIPISLDYSSKVWDIEFNTAYEFGGANFTESLAHYARRSSSGWTVNMGGIGVPEYDPRGSYSMYNIKGEPMCCPISGWFIERIAFWMPDGSARELRKSDIPVARDIRVPPPDGGTYVAVDDPRMKYDAANKVLYMPDGSRYTFNCCPDGVKYVQYIDRNGNVMNYDTRTGWTDTIGRRIGFSLNPASVQQQVTLPGPQGTTRTYTLVWKWLDEVLSSGGGEADLRYISDFVFHGGEVYSPSLFRSFTPDQLTGNAGRFNTKVLSDVILPNGQKYSFTYNIYGELDKIQLPTGGYHKYEYAIIPALDNRISVQVYGQANRGVIRHSISESGNGSDERAWHYSVSSDDSKIPYIVTETRPDNSRIERYIHRENDAGYQNFGINDVLTGRIYDERVYTTDNRMIRRTFTEWQRNIINYPPPIDTPKFATRNPRPVRIVEISLDTAPLTKTTTMSYDADLNITARNYHDYIPVAVGSDGSFLSGPLLKTEEATYLVNDPDIDQGIRAGYRSRNLISLPTKSIIRDGSGTIVSAAQYKYDESAYPLTTYPAVVSWADPQTPYRGNVTTVRSWLNTNSGSFTPWTGWTGGNWVTMHSWYDQCGNVVKTRDGKGGESVYSYSDNFEGVATQNSYAHLTSTSNALGHTMTSKYDYNTGLVIETADINGTITRNEYNDPFNRQTRSISAYGTNRQSQRTIQYNDTNNRVLTSSDLNAYEDNKLKSEVLYDGLGRVAELRDYEDATNYIRSYTEYDAMGRPHRASNKHRPGDPIAWNKTIYDPLGRVTNMETPDGARVTTLYGGNQITIIDEAGKRRRRVIDGRGRLISVTEDLSGSGYVTSYSYNALDNLIKVTQGPQVRTFAYDSMLRLVSATNPESGTITYAYDPNSNPIEKIDARGVKTTMTYDALNRITSKTYSGTTDEGRAAANLTKPVFNFYDDYSTLPEGAPKWLDSPSKGRLIGATYGTGSDGTYHQYDHDGNIVTNHQRMGTSNYVTRYTYDLANAVLTEKRRNARDDNDVMRVRSIYDPAGRLKQMMASFTPFISESILVRDISYTPFGALQSETYGNGLIHSMGYNNRLQTTEVRLGRLDNMESIFGIYNIFGTASNPNVSDPDITLLAQNNGNIARIKYFISGTLQYTQTLLYDGVDRIQYAVEHNNGNYTDEARAWYKTCEYDRWGNRGIKTASTSDNLDGGNTALQLADFSGANNRIIRADHLYDSAGNLIAAPGQTLTYDGDNRLVKAVVEGVTSEYVYDAYGRRVMKVVGGVGTIFEYDVAGKLIGERKASNNELTKGYFYRNGELIATTEDGTTHKFATSDHLGTPRAWTDRFGNLIERRDYSLFGQDLPAGIGIRSASIGYGGDSARQKFTGKEKDPETGLYFFQARYFSSLQGRFTSPDEFQGGPREIFVLGSGSPTKQALPYAEITNPQSLNKYTYCYNNPLRYTDPDGHIPVETAIDVLSFAASFYELIRNPSWTNLGFLAWDTAAMMIPYAPGSWVAKIGKAGYGGLKAAGIIGKLDDLETAANNTLIREGVALLGQGDKSVRKVLGLSDGSKAADFLGVTRGGKFHIAEAKGGDVGHAVSQLHETAKALKKSQGGHVEYSAEIILRKNTKIDPAYRVNDQTNYLEYYNPKTERWEVQHADGNPITVRRLDIE